LSYEHMRIAKLVRPGEVIINMFAGVGAFSIIIAKHAHPKCVYSIDINPVAYELMRENVRLNRVEDKVIPICDDAAHAIISRGLIHIADRVLMPLPSLALLYLPYAILSLRRSGGYIHTYLHVFTPRNKDAEDIAMEAVERSLDSLQIEYKILGARKVRSVGVRKLQIVVDVWCRGTQDDLPLPFLNNGKSNAYSY